MDPKLIGLRDAPVKELTGGGTGPAKSPNKTKAAGAQAIQPHYVPAVGIDPGMDGTQKRNTGAGASDNPNRGGTQTRSDRSTTDGDAMGDDDDPDLNTDETTDDLDALLETEQQLGLETARVAAEQALNRDSEEQTQHQALANQEVLPPTWDNADQRANEARHDQNELNEYAEGVTGKCTKKDSKRREQQSYTIWS